MKKKINFLSNRKDNIVYGDGVGISVTNQFLSGMPYWFGWMQPTSFSDIQPGVIAPIRFGIQTIVSNFTRLNIDFGDYTYASVNISGILLSVCDSLINKYILFYEKGYHKGCWSGCCGFTTYLNKGSICYQGLLTYTPLNPQLNLSSEYKYILVNTEFTENVVVQSIQLYAVREGLINLKVNFTLFFLKLLELSK